ncbi:MAG: hemerythrin domain-containing protein [Firmicutes bacterium]|nr:hemerythrin domain-containing protein [Bacillota bacterium]
MLNLIDQLRLEHTELSTSFGSLRDIDISTAEGREKLKSIKVTLLAHLRRDNEELYPKLREVASNDQKLQRTIEWFTRDTARISAVLILFLDQYADGGSKIAFMRDFKRLNTILNALIKQEEQLILDELDDTILGMVA